MTRYVHPEAVDATAVLGQRIRLARQQRGWTAAKLAQLLGVSRPTVTAIETGQLHVAVGTVFSAAALTGVRLFGAEGTELVRLRRAGADTLALLPARVHAEMIEIDDDF